MVKKEVTMIVWECDSCGKQVRANEGADYPAGWGYASGEIDLGNGPQTKAIDVCGQCSQNTDAAFAKYKTSLISPNYDV
ncbi:hypothetical protein FYZ48_09630 [Gimesia chilikensis]|uniref:hypothetical protein n=1 Tax=Gimesia chilikensis TaxID=2605989 RepID=UPI0011EDE0A2|nr:hypothetical protein [Gimesia chilikensis]KAA0140167.1 hypothetical protein FYZ48_09630 [Gimesia chilikensis]